VPLAEHDGIPHFALTLGRVSIHVPLAEHDVAFLTNKIINDSFNSRAPRGARHGQCASASATRRFQFTCPSRSTTSTSTANAAEAEFQFTCPSRSTTLGFLSYSVVGFVSIHVPLAEHDKAWRAGRSVSYRFNSRAPRGARPCALAILTLARSFQFTCPSRSTTLGMDNETQGSWFQFTCPSRSTTSLDV